MISNGSAVLLNFFKLFPAHVMAAVLTHEFRVNEHRIRHLKLFQNLYSVFIDVLVAVVEGNNNGF